MINFSGWLRTFKKGGDDEIVDDAVILEVTDVKKDGIIEIAFDDRGERCYLRFRLQDLAERCCLLVGTKVQ